MPCGILPSAWDMPIFYPTELLPLFQEIVLFFHKNKKKTVFALRICIIQERFLMHGRKNPTQICDFFQFFCCKQHSFVKYLEKYFLHIPFIKKSSCS